ncbi:MAG: HlyD family efflux transporter periplasmic adaptor subunit [Clostridia bacterium]|nr:HlyD family efflux transporter periplasmic adaptor subunit [Clostridia bacterium]
MAGKKVVRYRRRPKAAAIIFGIVLVYIICFISIYVSKAKVQTYEVEVGSLMNNASFTAVALRQEEVYNSSYSGDINYYQREGTRVMTNDTVYTVDETGRVSEILAQYTSGEGNKLSDENLAVIKNTLTNYITEYDDNDFSAVYDLKSDLNATVLQSINENIMANLDSIVTSTGSQDLFKTVKAEKPGIVVYSVDGYEGVTEETIGNVDFKKEAYDKQNLKTEKLIAANDPAYKLITSENWTLMFPLTQTDIDKYSLSSKDTISIKFTKDNITGTFPFKIVNNGKNSYGRITLSKYMIRYATERFLDIEIIVSGKSGIKVPVSAVTENEFYKIPKDYLITNGEKGNYGFFVEKNNEGQMTQVFQDVDIYKSTDDCVYVKKSELTAGTSIIKMDSNDRFVVGPVEKLKGVYCVNTGYTVFKLVEIIDGNNEYYIVKQSLSHGVSIYDRIILDADKYSENEMIY